MNLKPGDKIILTYTGERRVPKDGEFRICEWGRGLQIVQHVPEPNGKDYASVIFTAEYVPADSVTQ